MYVCTDCKKKFFDPKIYFERHNLDTPPYEKHLLCPYCESESIVEIEVRHCHCCGARLSSGNKGDYCNKSCKRRGEALWKMQEENKKHRISSPLFKMMCSLKEYNKKHNTNLSYGQFAALIESEKHGH